MSIIRSTPLVPISFGFLSQQLETTPDAGTERGVLLERARQDWRDMKVVCIPVLEFAGRDMKVVLLSSSRFNTFVCIYMRVDFCFLCLGFVFVFAGEKESQMDPKGDEGVPRVRGEGGRL